MKSPTLTKLMQYLMTRNNEQGFTLIELLFVIIIIGILSAIALPSFLGCGVKARSSQAKTIVGSINRAQQSYRLEHPQFANSISQLKIGIKEESEDYNYSIKATKNSTFVYAITKNKNLKSFLGAVYILPSGRVVAISCQTIEPSSIIPGQAIYEKGLPSCPEGTVLMK